MIFPSLAPAQEFLNWLIKYDPAPKDINNPIIVGGSYKLLLRTQNVDIELTKQVFNSKRSNMQVFAYYR
jgi:hypothetical protein